MVEVYTGKGTIHVTIYSDLGFREVSSPLLSLSLSSSLCLAFVPIFDILLLYYLSK